MHKADVVKQLSQRCGPKAYTYYNKKMGGVDKNDTIGNYSCIRKTQKWYTKIFFHLLEEAVYNAFVLSAEKEEKEVHAIKLEIVCHHTETSQLICRTNMMATLAFNGLKANGILQVLVRSSNLKTTPTLMLSHEFYKI